MVQMMLVLAINPKVAGGANTNYGHCYRDAGE